MMDHAHPDLELEKIRQRASEAKPGCPAENLHLFRLNIQIGGTQSLYLDACRKIASLQNRLDTVEKIHRHMQTAIEAQPGSVQAAIEEAYCRARDEDAKAACQRCGNEVVQSCATCGPDIGGSE
jgi:hypothetical protein